MFSNSNSFWNPPLHLALRLLHDAVQQQAEYVAHQRGGDVQPLVAKVIIATDLTPARPRIGERSLCIM